MLEVAQLNFPMVIQDLTMPNVIKQSWEVLATKLANADNDDVFDVYHSIAESVKAPMDEPARVVFARDTRASGTELDRYQPKQRCRICRPEIGRPSKRRDNIPGLYKRITRPRRVRVFLRNVRRIIA